jgi:DNA-binding MarR family transcriptional regulator
VKLLEKTAPKKSKAPVKGAEDLFRVADWPMHYLLAIDRHHVRNMSRVLAPYKCSPLVWRVLSILADRDGHSVSELAELSVIERSNLGRILEGMERDRLVERLDRETDKRQTAILLSQQGHKLFVESLPAVLQYYAHFLNGILPTETAVLMSVLKKIKRNVTTFDSNDVGGI